MPLPALANDSTAELGTGGLILSRSDVIAMEREDLSISLDNVTVDYVFRNSSDKDIETIVAFPMPDIEGNPYRMTSIPDDEKDNFLDFAVTVDGNAVAPELEQKAFALGIDISEELRARGVPLYPYGEAVLKALAALPQEVADKWQERGMIVIDEYDDGSGWKRVRTPFWQLKTTYWWRAMFPANGEVTVQHSYRPSVGATTDLSFLVDGRFEGDSYAEYKHRYCFDKSFENAVLKAARRSSDGYAHLMENRIAYILTTGGNWANGTIGAFKLTVDKGDPKNLVSFCGRNVRKTGPTTFEMTAEDFYPERDLDILILSPVGMGEGEAGGAGREAQSPAPAKPGASKPESGG
uniref:DUF4424 domain-containing protein n=1 Tax=unclassified Mesorhizobium TaxID=325217 RepID=UPI0019266E89|nr:MULTISPECIES: DUF4424 domain-containing protein [unclassified Mesorhizobium]